MPTLRLQAVVAYLVLTACIQVRGADAPTYVAAAIQHPVIVSDWVMDPESRRVFAALPDAAAVAVHDPQTGKEIKRLTVNGRPLKLFISKGQLIVVSSGPEILFFDVQTGKQTGVVTNAGQPVFAAMAASDAPYLYVLSIFAQGGSDSALLQIDLAERVIRNRFNWSEHGIHMPSSIALSRSGELLAARSIREISSGTADLYRFDEDIFQLEQIDGAVTPQGVMKGDWIMSRWWIGSTLKDKFLTKVVRQFPGELSLLHPLYDLTLSIDADVTMREQLRGTLTLSRYSDGEVLKQLPLPWPTIKPDAPAYPNYDDESVRLRRLAIDRSGDFVLAAAGSNALVLDLKKTEAADFRPLLQVDWPADLAVQVDEPIAVPLELTNPAATAKATFKLAGAPKGMTLDGKTIRWRPTYADIGTHEFSVEVRSGSDSDTSKLAIEVQAPNLNTSVMVQQLYADEGGKFACLLGQPSENFANNARQSLFSTPTKMVILDVANTAIVARHSLDGEVREVLMDDRHVYWLSKSVNVLHRLELKAGGKHEEMPLQMSVSELFFIGNDELGMMTSEPQAALAVVLDRSTFRPIPNHPLSKITYPRSGGIQRDQSNEILPIGDGQLMFIDRLLNQADGSTRCFPSRFGHIPYVTAQAVGWVGLQAFPGSDFQFLWRRLVTAGGVYKVGAQALFEWNDRLWDVSPTIPLAATVSFTEPRGQEAITLMLELRDLVFGRVLHQEVSPIRIVDTTGMRRMLSKVRFAGDRIVLATGDRVGVHRVPEEVRAKLVEPLRLQYPQTEITAATRPVTLQLASKGGTGPYRYSLQEETSGVTLDAATGRLEMDLPTLWPQFIQQLRTGERSDLAYSVARGAGGVQPKTPTIDVPAGQQLLAVPLHLTSIDANGQTNSISLSYLTYGPQGEVDAAVKSQQKDMVARMRERQRAARQAMVDDADRDNDDGEVNRRLDEIDSRLDAIEQLLRTQKQ